MHVNFILYFLVAHSKCEDGENFCHNGGSCWNEYDYSDYNENGTRPRCSCMGEYFGPKCEHSPNEGKNTHV